MPFGTLAGGIIGGILTIIAGIIILVWPRIITTIVGIYLIVVGAITLFGALAG